MSVVSVRARSFILALFIRDDGERFLLGDNGFDFKDSQLHFSANTIENDEVAKQGVDGVMLAGQVRRASVQSFDGYVGDATTLKEEVEQMRRDFIAFFAKGHHFRVIYVDCNRNAWQRKGGYLVDAPEVKELWQIHPEYHVGLNFEDVNYYEYDENAEGQEILANIMKVPISSDVEGGLVWDEDGAVSEPAEIEYDGDTATASGKSISVSDAVEAPLTDFKLKGETSQNGTPTPSAPVAVQTVTGENVVKICGKNLWGAEKHGNLNENTGQEVANNNRWVTDGYIPVKSNTAYTLSSDAENLWYIFCFYDANQNFISGVSYYGNSQTQTTPANCKFVRCVICDTATIKTTQRQLEEGSTAGAYEPYQGQSYEVNLGKNLFDKDNASGLFQGYISGGKAWNASGFWSYYIPCQPNTTYTASRMNIGNGGRFAIATSQAVPASGVDVAQLTQDNTATSLTITTDSSAKYIIVWFANVNDAGSESLADWEAVQQIEKGSTPTSYAAYFTPIELCKIGDYQDYIYKSGGKWYVHKEVGKILSYSGETISTDYISTTGSLTTGATIYYALATPTDTEITNEALIAQLEAILSQGSTYAGTNNITTVITAGNEQGELEITYYTKYEAKAVGGGYVWEAGGSGGPTIVTNESISAVSPVWTVFGPALNPTLENTTTGEQIQYVGMIGEGQTLVVDMGEQTARLDGLNVISNIVGEYLTLAPGSNTLLFSAEGDAPASEIGWSEIVG